MTKNDFIEKMNGAWFRLEDKQANGLCNALYTLPYKAREEFSHIFKATRLEKNRYIVANYWFREGSNLWHANDTRFFVWNWFKLVCLEDKLYKEW